MNNPFKRKPRTPEELLRDFKELLHEKRTKDKGIWGGLKKFINNVTGDAIFHKEVKFDIFKKVIKDNPVNKEGKGFLHLLAAEEDSMLIAMFMAQGNIKDWGHLKGLMDKKGRIPLHYAILSNNVHSARILTPGKKEINFADEDGKTPLLLALEIDNRDILGIARGLIENEADVKVSLRDGATPLHLVVKAKNGEWSSKVFKMLLSKGANVDALDNEGNTPLHVVAKNNNVEAAEMLFLQWRADVNIRNKEGKLAVDLVTDKSPGGENLKKLLSSTSNLKGGNPNRISSKVAGKALENTRNEDISVVSGNKNQDWRKDLKGESSISGEQKIQKNKENPKSVRTRLGVNWEEEDVRKEQYTEKLKKDRESSSVKSESQIKR